MNGGFGRGKMKLEDSLVEFGEDIRFEDRFEDRSDTTAWESFQKDGRRPLVDAQEGT